MERKKAYRRAINQGAPNIDYKKQEDADKLDDRSILSDGHTQKKREKTHPQGQKKNPQAEETPSRRSTPLKNGADSESRRREGRQWCAQRSRYFRVRGFSSHSHGGGGTVGGEMPAGRLV